MWNRGKLLIIGIVAVALVAASFSAWYHRRSQSHVLRFWGTSAAVLIAEAPDVEVVRLDSSGPVLENSEADSTESEKPQGPTIEFQDELWRALSSQDAHSARGMSNLRRALVLDTSYDWEDPGLPEGQTNWQYALDFHRGEVRATVFFDFESQQVALAGGERTAVLNPEANRDLREFFAEQFPDEQGESASPSAAPAKPTDEKPADESETLPETPALEEPVAEPKVEESAAQPAEAVEVK